MHTVILFACWYIGIYNQNKMLTHIISVLAEPVQEQKPAEGNFCFIFCTKIFQILYHIYFVLAIFCKHVCILYVMILLFHLPAPDICF